MDSVRYWLAVVTIVTFPPAFLFWFIAHPFIEFWRRLGSRATYSIISVVCVGVGYGIYTQRGALLGTDFGGHWALYTLAAIFYFIATVIGVYAKRHLSFRILVGLPMFKAPEAGPGTLLNEGIYARIRHPRYASAMFGAASFALLANYLGCWILVAVIIPVLYALVLIEERELRRRFGDAYVRYSETVPRFFPQLRS